MKHSYNYHVDPGHGWLAVPKMDLEELGIRNLISGYSYQSGNTAYLEEDCDMSVFFKAYREKFGKDPVIVEKYHANRAPCKSYAHYITSFDYDPEAYRKYLFGEATAAV